MTAFDLIDSIFARPQQRLSANLARLTPEQLRYLRDLIARDPEGAKVRAGAPGSLVWTPAGKHKYVITEDLAGTRHRLLRLSAVEAEGSGTLF